MRRPTPAEQPIPSGTRTADAIERIGPDAVAGRVAAVVAVGYVCIVLIGVLVGTAVEAADGMAFDEAQFMASLTSDRWAPMTDAAALFGNFSDTWTVIGMASGAVVILSLSRFRRQIVVLVGALALELSAYLTITYLVGRPRPPIDATASLPSTPSFPSGHVAAAVVLYGSMAVIVWSLDSSRRLRAGSAVVAVLVPALVAFSRVYEGLHYPTDVAAGALLGASCLFVAITAAGQMPVRPTPSDGAAADVTPAHPLSRGAR